MRETSQQQEPSQESGLVKWENINKKYGEMGSAMEGIRNTDLSGYGDENDRTLEKALKESDDWASLKEEDKEQFNKILIGNIANIKTRRFYLTQLENKLKENNQKEVDKDRTLQAAGIAGKELYILLEKQKILRAIAYINGIDLHLQEITYPENPDKKYIESVEDIEAGEFKALIADSKNFYKEKNADSKDNETVYFSVFDKKSAMLLSNITERLEERIEEERVKRSRNKKEEEDKKKEPKKEMSEAEKEKEKNKKELERLTEINGKWTESYKKIESALPNLIVKMDNKVKIVERIMNGYGFKTEEEKNTAENRLNGLQIINKMFSRLPERFKNINFIQAEIPKLSGDADQDYYKIKEFRENAERIRGKVISFIKELLPSFDGIERHLQSVGNKEFSQEQINIFEKMGIQKTYEEMKDGFYNFAKNIGLEKIEAKKGGMLNDEQHTVVGVEKDKIGIHKNEEIHSLGRSGFNYNGELLREAEVIVWKK